MSLIRRAFARCCAMGELRYKSCGTSNTQTSLRTWHSNVQSTISRLYLQKERRMATREPTPLGQKQYFAVLNFARDLRWIDQEKPQQLLGNDEVIGKILDQLLSLVDRLNRGEVPSEDY
jgi:hypothetical protein